MEHHKHVFISYVREDSEIVDKLAAALQKRGIEVWLDRQKIHPGERWRDAIEKAIANGAFFLACFSKHHALRESSYMNEELTVAIDNLRLKPNNRTWFIPALIDETPLPSIRISSTENLSHLHFAKMYENWDAELENICQVINKSVKSDKVYKPLDIVLMMRKATTSLTYGGGDYTKESSSPITRLLMLKFSDDFATFTLKYKEIVSRHWWRGDTYGFQTSVTERVQGFNSDSILLEFTLDNKYSRLILELFAQPENQHYWMRGEMLDGLKADTVRIVLGAREPIQHVS